MNTSLTRRESLWADEPVMRDGKCLDIAHEVLKFATDVQSEVLNAIKSGLPDHWLSDAEHHAEALLSHIRSMRAVLK